MVNRTNKKTVVRKALTLIVLTGLVGSGAVAGTFVSFNGRFQISYPDSWGQIDYRTAEYYLSRGDAEADLDYEAVFSAKANYSLFQGQYLILTVDTVGSLTSARVDSVLDELTTEFDRPITELASDDFMTRIDSRVIFFDREQGLAALESEVASDDSGPRTNLLVMKFYEHGIANFYFYAPTPEYEASLPLYRQIATSFSTEAIDDALPSEPVKVADIEADNGGSGNLLLLFGGLFVILIAILVTRIRTRSHKP